MPEQNFLRRRHVMNDDEKTAEWDGVLRALGAVDRSGFVPLEHVAGVTYLIKRHAKRQVSGAHYYAYSFSCVGLHTVK